VANAEGEAVPHALPLAAGGRVEVAHADALPLAWIFDALLLPLNVANAEGEAVPHALPLAAGWRVEVALVNAMPLTVGVGEGTALSDALPMLLAPPLPLSEVEGLPLGARVPDPGTVGAPLGVLRGVPLAAPALLLKDTQMEAGNVGDTDVVAERECVALRETAWEAMPEREAAGLCVVPPLAKADAEALPEPALAMVGTETGVAEVD
jgi:hypothetical protein